MSNKPTSYQEILDIAKCAISNNNIFPDSTIKEPGQLLRFYLAYEEADCISEMSMKDTTWLLYGDGPEYKPFSQYSDEEVLDAITVSFNDEDLDCEPEGWATELYEALDDLIIPWLGTKFKP